MGVEQRFTSVTVVTLTRSKSTFFFLLLQPDREDELRRIEGQGGKVINWNGARVFGVLAMSRAIGIFSLYFVLYSLRDYLQGLLV